MLAGLYFFAEFKCLIKYKFFRISESSTIIHFTCKESLRIYEQRINGLLYSHKKKKKKWE